MKKNNNIGGKKIGDPIVTKTEDDYKKLIEAMVSLSDDDIEDLKNQSQRKY